MIPLQLLHTQRAIARDFGLALRTHGWPALRASGIETLQVNVGRRCNQVCRHCHIDAGPHRTEEMDAEVADLVLGVVQRHAIQTLDITGGAPELNPHFRRLVTESRGLGAEVIDRCNLTILLEPGFEDLGTFLADNRVHVIASLPCYNRQNVDAQRGDGVFTRSIAALKRLNGLGYGREGGNLRLDLIYNPLGPSLAPPQESLEAAYRKVLLERDGIVFHTLLAMNNVPINRFAGALSRDGMLGTYVDDLAEAFNADTVESLMCRRQLSVRWDGYLFDCDFNLIDDLHPDGGPMHIRDLDMGALRQRRIATAAHCFACTAGSGSSCGGSLVERAS